MNKSDVKKFLKRNWSWIVIIVFLAILSLKNYKDNIDLENSGLIVSVTVEYYSRESLRRGGATKTLSRGYYYVDNKRYKCYSVGVIPIGSTFKIKYNPRDPEEWRFVEE